MSDIVAALAPIFALILLGAWFKRRGWLSDSFWRPAETLTYYVFFPALLLVNIASADLGGLAILPMAAALLSGLLLVTGLVIALRRPLAVAGPAFTSVFQGAIRPNTYVGVAAAAALFDRPGLTLVAVCIAFVVPTVNVLAVSVLAMHGAGNGGPPGQTRGWRGIVREVARNPIILACLAGALLNLSGIGAPPLVTPLFEILGRAALPVGLLAVGAGLDVAAARRAGAGVVTAAGLKLLVLPLLTALCLWVFDVEGVTRSVAVVYAALPCSASAYVLARQMGGDAPLMAGIITATTLGAMATMPVMLALLG